jgi:hypothetical protein
MPMGRVDEALAEIRKEVCLRLMGKKLLVALAMEGKFASEGLQAIDGDDDMLTAMARELVENKGIGESAESIWRQLRPVTSQPAQDETSDTPTKREGVDASTMVPLATEAILGATRLETAGLPRSSSRKNVESSQLSLF